MQSLSEVHENDFQQALTPERVRSFQVIYTGLAIGPILFTFAVVWMYINGGAGRTSQDMINTVEIQTLLNICLVVLSPIAGWWVSSRAFLPSNLASAVSREFRDGKGEILAQTPAEKCVMVIRTSSIIQLATLEGPAFFGLVATVNAISTGVAYSEPMYTANILSIIPGLFYFATTFPTKDRLQDVFMSRIAGIH